jgi:hypothetical protein
MGTRVPAFPAHLSAIVPLTGFIVHNEDQTVDAVQRLGARDRTDIRREFEHRFTAPRVAQNYLKLYARLFHARRLPSFAD